MIELSYLQFILALVGAALAPWAMLVGYGVWQKAQTDPNARLGVVFIVGALVLVVSAFLVGRAL